MNQYIEFRIKKRVLIILVGFICIVVGITGWYFWSSYHPNINIQVSDGTAGDHLKVEELHITYMDKNGIPMASAIELKINDLAMQHEFMCKSIKDNYSESNIKLKIVEKNGKTNLKYYGSALL